MPQKRDLQPVTVYLPPAVIAFYEKQAAQTVGPVSAELRRIILADYSQKRNV